MVGRGLRNIWDVKEVKKRGERKITNGNRLRWPDLQSGARPAGGRDREREFDEVKYAPISECKLRRVDKSASASS